MQPEQLGLCKMRSLPSFVFLQNLFLCKKLLDPLLSLRVKKHAFFFALKSIFVLFFLHIFFLCYAQDSKTDFYSRNFITIDTLTQLYINGDFINDMSHDAAVRNAGELHLTGGLVNKGGRLFFFSTNGQSTFSAADTIARKDSVRFSSPLVRRGSVYFAGKNRQKIVNSAVNGGIYLSDVYLNNDVELTSDIHMQGKLTFQKNVYLNGYNLLLYAEEGMNKYGGTGVFFNESEDACVRGAGSIIAYKGNDDAPLNGLKSIGLEIFLKNTSKVFVKVIRTNDSMHKITDTSINRQFTILKQGGDLSDTFRFHYFKHDVKPHQMLSGFSAWNYNDQQLPKAIRLESKVDTVNRTVTAIIDWDTVAKPQDVFRITVAKKNCDVLPEIDLGKDTNICHKNPLTLHANIKNAGTFPGKFVYYWNGSLIKDTNFFKVPQDSSKIYFVRVISENGCENSDSVVVKYQPNPKPFITSKNDDLLKCMTDPFTFYHNDTSGKAVISSYLWNFGDGAVSYLADSVEHSYDVGSNSYIEPLIKLNVVSNYGCKDSTTFNVRLENKPFPEIHVGYVTDSIRKLDALTIHTPASKPLISWFVNGDSVSNADRFFHTFPCFDTFDVRLNMKLEACSNDTSVKVIIRDRADVRFEILENKRNFCVGDVLTLVDKTVEYDKDKRTDDDLKFTWYFGNKRESEPTYYFSTPGKYVLKLVAATGSWQREYIDSVFVYPNPKINFGREIHTCRNSIMLKPQDSGVSYLWSDRSTKPTLTVEQSGFYTLRLTSVQGCYADEEVTVILNTQISTGLPKDTARCGELSLSVNYPNAEYLWSNGKQTREVDIRESGTYFVKLKDSICEITDTIKVLIKEVPNLNPGGDTSVCSNEVIMLHAGNDTPASYLWNTGFTDSAIAVSTGGVYTVKAVHPSGCEQMAEVFVQYKDAPKFDLGSDRLLCDQVPATFDLTAQAGASMIRWTLPDKTVKTGTVLSSNQQGMHAVYVEYINGCRASDSVKLTLGATGLKADFLLSSAIKKNDTVHIINLSQSEGRELSYVWEISNGYRSTDESPYYRFLVNGDYEVKLTVSDGSLCPSVKTKIICVSNDGFRMPGIDGKTDEDHSDDGIWVEPEDEIENGIAFIGFANVKLYPNPNKGRFTTEVELSTEALLHSMLIDNSGRILDKRSLSEAHKFILEYNLEGRRSGIYVLKLWSGMASREFKIILVND